MPDVTAKKPTFYASWTLFEPNVTVFVYGWKAQSLRLSGCDKTSTIIALHRIDSANTHPSWLLDNPLTYWQRQG